MDVVGLTDGRTTQKIEIKTREEKFDVFLSLGSRCPRVPVSSRRRWRSMAPSPLFSYAIIIIRHVDGIWSGHEMNLGRRETTGKLPRARQYFNHDVLLILTHLRFTYVCLK